MDVQPLYWCVFFLLKLHHSQEGGIPLHTFKNLYHHAPSYPSGDLRSMDVRGDEQDPMPWERGISWYSLEQYDRFSVAAAHGANMPQG